MGGPGRNKDTARRTPVAHLKATQALELRVRGASVRGISEALDLSVRYTKLLLARALARVEVPGALELKKLSLQRLDTLRARYSAGSSAQLMMVPPQHWRTPWCVANKPLSW
jgi:hypothetical protein